MLLNATCNYWSGGLRHVLFPSDIFSFQRKLLHVLGSFLVLPSSTYLLTAGVEGVYFHLITLRHTPQSVELIWTGRPIAETST
jgi:hypothetical protein